MSSKWSPAASCRWHGTRAPLVATNDVHDLRQGDAEPNDVLLCIGTGKTVNDAEWLRYHGRSVFPEDC